MSIPGLEFIALIATLLVFLLISRTFILKSLDRLGKNQTGYQLIESSSSNSQTNKLRPAEIAYLVRKGDTTHALIVIAFDLMQRSVKNTGDTSFKDGLTNYEKNMWKVTKDALKNWASQTAKEQIIGKSLNPIHIAKRLSFVYKFVTSSLKSLVQDLVTDPKRIRQYFSSKGLWRIIADFSSQGYKQAFEQELRTTLLDCKLIVLENEKQKYSQALLAVSVLGVVGTLIISLISFKFIHVAIILWFFSLIAASGLRLMLVVRQLLPLYEELQVVAEQINRKSRRLSFLKAVLKSVDLINWLAAAFLVFIVSSIGILMAKLSYFDLAMVDFYCYLALLVANFVCAELLAQSLDIGLNDYPTERARKELEQVKQELKDLKPLDSFKELLESDEYNPELSKLLAVYGVETLFILA